MKGSIKNQEAVNRVLRDFDMERNIEFKNALLTLVNAVHENALITSGYRGSTMLRRALKHAKDTRNPGIYCDLDGHFKITYVDLKTIGVNSDMTYLDNMKTSI